MHNITDGSRRVAFAQDQGKLAVSHVNKTAFGAVSPRTNVDLFAEVSETLGYRPISFRAMDASGTAIYHTNVMMTVGPGFAVVCLASIEDQRDKTLVTKSLSDGGLEIVDISFEQMNRFAGNMLAVSGGKNTTFLVLSTNALGSFSTTQKATLEKYCELLPVSIPTIETHGGGGARCMMAEVFLPCLE